MLLGHWVTACFLEPVKRAPVQTVQVVVQHLAPLGAQPVKKSAVQETWVRSLGWEDPLEEGMAAHSSLVAWRIPWTEQPGGLRSKGTQELDMTEAT